MSFMIQIIHYENNNTFILFAGAMYKGLAFQRGNCGVSIMRSGTKNNVLTCIYCNYIIQCIHVKKNSSVRIVFRSLK